MRSRGRKVLGGAEVRDIMAVGAARTCPPRPIPAALPRASWWMDWARC